MNTEKAHKRDVAACLRLGEIFDEIDSTEEKYKALVMLTLGFFVERVQPDYYDNVLGDISKTVLTALRDKDLTFHLTEVRGHA